MKYIKEEKIKDIKLNKGNMFILLDFDRTITTFDSLDSWGVTGVATSKECERKVDKLYEKYRPIETNYDIPYIEKYKEMDKWYNLCMNLFLKDKLNKNKIEEAVKTSRLIFKEGAKEFLEYTFKNKIPVVILSAGIGNIIEEFLKKNNCYFENIFLISNTFLFNDKNEAFKLKNSLIHTMNKNVEGHLTGKWKEEFIKRKYRLLIGDTIEDINMTLKTDIDKTIKIGLLDNQENLEKYKEKFDIVLTDNDVSYNIIRKILGI